MMKVIKVTFSGSGAHLDASHRAQTMVPGVQSYGGVLCHAIEVLPGGVGVKAVIEFKGGERAGQLRSFLFPMDVIKSVEVEEATAAKVVDEGRRRSA